MQQLGTLQRSFRLRKLTNLAGLYLFWLSVAALCFSHTPSTFLRAESGYFQIQSRQSTELQRQFVRRFFATSYHGHYTPLAFRLELEQTKLAGTRAIFWKCRSVAALALVLTAFFVLARAVAAAFSISLVPSVLISGGLVALFAFQPLMIEFVAWPFLILQMGWMFLSAVALTGLVNSTTSARPAAASKWIWLSAAAAYASMHCTGLGLVTAVATSAVLVLLLVEARTETSIRSHRKQIGAALICLSLLAALHLLCMASLPPVSGTANSVSTRVPDLRSLLGFAAMYPLFIYSSYFVISPPRYDVAVLMQSAWPFAIALLALAVASVASLIWKPRTKTDSPDAATLPVLLMFSFASYATFSALVAFREMREPSALPLFGMFAGARYIVPATWILFGFFLSLIGPLGARKPGFASSAFALLALCAFISQSQFARRVLPKLQPKTQISHAHAWSLIVAMSSEARLAGLPVPNVIMADLTQEFYGWDLKLFEPVLRHDLHLKPDEQIAFIDVKEALGPRSAEYARAVPSFIRLREMMHVKAPVRR